MRYRNLRIKNENFETLQEAKQYFERKLNRGERMSWDRLFESLGIAALLQEAREKDRKK